ncbi:MAG: aminopeptidase P N-terminal domain-containing protein [Myxococcales bacterium]|nr:aminopeptidase P N-terminal domain-containing protein [Myxococcales bacterium]
MKPLFDLSAYADRRATFFDRALPNAALLLPSSPVSQRSHDLIHPYRADNDVSYLTGLEEPESVALLLGGADPKVVLFVRPRDPATEKWDGARLGTEGAVSILGADEAYPIDELKQRLGELLAGRDALYYRLNHRRDVDSVVLDTLDALRGARRKPDQAPGAILDPRPVLHDMRRVKRPEELPILRRAAEISAEAHLAAMRHCKPGMMEYEVAALLDHEFRRRGGNGPAFETIVGGGANAIVLHYITNHEALREGDMVLVDAGAEYKLYNGDITRTFPVGKAYSGAQRDLYQAVLNVQVEAIAKVGEPGQSPDSLTNWSRRELTRALVDLGLLSGDVDELYESEAYQRFYMHNLGHYLGMDVHDVGSYFVGVDKARPFDAGVVYTVEPGLYIPTDDDIPEAFRGLGVRIEDDVLVTENGPEVLTSAAPKAIDEIEAIRREAL